MKNFIKSYRNDKWYSFSDNVKIRDNYLCLHCGRSSNEVVLQVHHKHYIVGYEPWEYALSDCLTLCKGCHAIEHKLIEPNNGWTLIAIDDLGGLHGICEKKGCGTEIRYAHLTYHPDWGYKTVGSSCIEYLTEEDKQLSTNILKIYDNMSKFVHNSIWEIDFTKSGKGFIATTYKHNWIRIYGKENRYSFQIFLKIKGEKRRDWNNAISTNNKNINQVKEMAYIVCKGMITEDEKEKDTLRNIYRSIMSVK